MQVVVHFFFLCAHISEVVWIRLYLDGQVLHDFYSVTLQPDPLHGVVGQESQACSAHLAQDLCAHAVVALIGSEAEMDVCLHGIVALLLQFVGAYLVHQSDTPTLLVHIDDDTFARLVNHLHGAVQLLSALAAHGAEHIARHAGRVHAAEDGLALLPLAFHQRHMLQSVGHITERREHEVAIGSGERDSVAAMDKGRSLRCGGYFLRGLLSRGGDCRTMLQAIGNKVFDSNDFQVVLARHLLQLRHARHRAVGVHDFDERRSGIEPRQTRQVDGCFGMSRALEDTAGTRIEGVDMPRTPEGLGLGRGVCQRTDSGGTVGCRHTRGATFQLVHRYRERCAEHGGIVRHLVRQIQFGTTLLRDGRTQHAATVLEHEIDFLRRDFLGGDDEIAFVLTVLIVHYNHKLSVTEIIYGFFYFVQHIFI